MTPADSLPLSEAAKHLLHVGTLWDVVVDSGEAETDNDIAGMLLMTEEREMRAAMNLRAIDRLRDELDRIPGHAAPTDPVTVRAADAVLIARMLLSRFS